MLENDKIIIKDDSGVEKEFYKLVSFHSTKTNKDYLIYCDDDKKLYSSVVEKDELGGIQFRKIDREDLDEVNKALLQVKDTMGLNI